MKWLIFSWFASIPLLRRAFSIACSRAGVLCWRIWVFHSLLGCRDSKMNRSEWSLSNLTIRWQFFQSVNFPILFGSVTMQVTFKCFAIVFFYLRSCSYQFSVFLDYNSGIQMDWSNVWLWLETKHCRHNWSHVRYLLPAMLQKKQFWCFEPEMRPRWSHCIRR